MHPRLVAAAAAVALAACASEPPVETSPSGAPRIRADAVERHAEQFDSDVPVRTPGSEEELAAASYILGHLQQAGYVPLLDPVPVGNLVESTNVVALPVAGGELDTLVVVSYGTSSPGSGGEAIGLFLELARALNAAEPSHAVGFAAIGADRSPRLGGSLGTRRLLQYLADEGLTPHVITMSTTGGALVAAGDRAEEIVAVAGAGEVEPARPDDAFRRARLDHTSVAGPPVVVGEALLEFLAD